MSDKLCVIGAGSWGTTLALLLARKGYPVTLWTRRQEQADDMRRYGENRLYLPGHILPENLMVSGPEEIPDRAAVAVMAVPSAHLRRITLQMLPLLRSANLVICATKGLEIETGLRMSQVISSLLGHDCRPAVTALSGPNLSAEVAAGLPAASVVAGPTAATGQARDLLMSDTFRLYTNDDLAGVELGGALKNIMAIGAGLSDGLGYGDNTKAALLTRGIVEMTRLGVALGARAETFYGLSGLGDLMATAMSPRSRNHSFGHAVGSGSPVQEVLSRSQMVVEGVPTTRAARTLAGDKGLETPIIEQIFQVIYCGKSPAEAVHSLMVRLPKSETQP